MTLLYDELRSLAAHYLDRERKDHTLQPTALVHEAYLRLSANSSVVWRDKVHFFVAASGTIRRVLVDHARARLAAKRRPIELTQQNISKSTSQLDCLVLDESLRKLQALDDSLAQIVDLRFFGGLSIEETAEVLCLSPSTIKNKWSFARTWLRRELGLRN